MVDEGTTPNSLNAAQNENEGTMPNSLWRDDILFTVPNF